MSGFYRQSELAEALGIEERTLRRWLQENSVRHALKAARRGKQWRIPKTDDSQVRSLEVIEIAESLRKLGKRIPDYPSIKRILKYGGFGSRDRDRHYQILRKALEIERICRRQKKIAKWRHHAENLAIIARQIVAKYGCTFQAVPRKLKAFLTAHHQDNQESGVPYKSSRQIDYLVECYKDIWPNKKAWEAARKAYHDTWQRIELSEAARRLAACGEKINATGLCGEIYLNQIKKDQKQKGIGLRTFRRWFRKKHIEWAQRQVGQRSMESPEAKGAYGERPLTAQDNEVGGFEESAGFSIQEDKW